MSLIDELEKSVMPIWDKMAEHPFMQGIREGTLSDEQYGFYVAQNYPYLFYYAKAVAMACQKCEDVKTLKKLTWIFQQVVNDELDLNYENAQKLGYKGDKLLNNRMSPEIFGYANYLIKTAYEGDLADCIMVLYSCPASYAYVAKKLKNQGIDKGLMHPQYGPWLKYYTSYDADEYRKIMAGIIDELEDAVSDEKNERMKNIMTAASQYDYMCLEMG